MKVVSKKELGPRQVFDIEVDQVHNFYADGINVHNCATGGGVSVIKHNGTVVNSASGNSFNAVTLTPNILGIGRAADSEWRWSLNPGNLGAGFAIAFDLNTAAPDFNLGNTNGLIAAGRADFVRRSSTAGAVQRMRHSEAAVARSVTSTITNTFNTGHQPGDIRRTYLSDNVVESVGPSTEFVDISNAFAGTHYSDATVSYDLTAKTVTLNTGTLTNDGGNYGSALIPLVGLTIGKVYLIRVRVVSVSTGSIFFKIFNSVAGNNGAGVLNLGTLAVGNSYIYQYTATAANVWLGWQQQASGATSTLADFSVSDSVLDRSYKAQGANITGTLVKSQVASAAELVAFSGFSASNYLREPYSADLDFGTGEWSCGAWVNFPAVSPVGKAATGPNLQSNGDFSNGTTGWSNFSGSLFFSTVEVVDGRLRLATDGGRRALFGNGGQSPWQLVVGRAYKVTLDVEITDGLASNFAIVINSGFAGVRMGPSWLGGETEQWAGLQNVTGVQSITGYFIAIATTGGITFDVPSGVVKELYVDNVVVQEISTPAIASRRFSSGAYIELGASYYTDKGTVAGGYLTATAFDGTTTRTVTTSAAYNTATWVKPEAVYTTDGTLAIRVNGVEVAAIRGNPLLTLNNSSAVLTIGNSYALDAPFPGSIALLKLSATVPTPEQSVWMYEQEKQLFRANAKCCLPDAGAIVDLTYDDATDKWIAVSATNESEWSGLVRTSVTPVPAGSYTRAIARSGIQMLARSTTSPGVDITIPAYGLREELVNRAEAAARLNAQLATYDYVGGFTANTTNGNTAIVSVAGLTYPTSYIGARVSGSGIPANTTIVAVSGTTIYLSAAATATATGVQISFADFILPVGMEAKEVSLAGEAQREGATAQYTRLFDGFKETIRFGTPPSHTALVQIQAARSAA